MCPQNSLRGPNYGVFTLPNSYSYTDPNEIYKAYTWTNSDGDSYGDSNVK